MADEQNGSYVTRSVSRLMRLMGISYPASVSDIKAPTEIKQHLGIYSADELRYMKGYNDKDSSARASGFYEELLKIASSSTNTSNKLKNLTSIAPEVPMIIQVFISSILSPNDMQTDLVQVRSNGNGFDNSTIDPLVKMINDHVNDEFRFGEKFTKWLKNVFEKGSQPVIITPQGYLRDITSAVELDTIKKGIGSFGNTIEVDTEGFQINIEDEYFQSSAFTDEITSTISNIASVESLDDKQMKEVTEYFKAQSMSVLKTGSGFFTYTKNPNELTRVSRQNNKAIKQLEDKINRYFSSIRPETDQNGVIPPDPILSVSDVMNTMKDHDMPTIIEWTPEATIPVCVPGTNSEHLLYICLTNADDGSPLKLNPVNEYTNDLSPDKMSQAANNAIFGNQTALSSITQWNTATKTSASAAVFSIAFRHLLEAQLKKEGLTGLSIGMHSAVGKAIFSSVLSGKRIKMFIVPSSMMMYYALDYREDGTGKSFLEDSEFILSMRTNLIVANVMSAFDNATRYKTITVDVDEKNTNIIQTLEAIRRADMLKHTPKFTTDPTQAIGNIYAHHTNYKLQGVGGNANMLDVSVDQKLGSGAGTPDNTWLDTLNNWAALSFRMPPSVVNQLNETEFSRSVAVQNILFANRIRLHQTDLAPINKKFIINYVLNHAGLMKQIRDTLALQTDEEKKVASSIQPDVEKMAASNNAEVIRFVHSLEIALPPPNVSTTKTQYEELSNYANGIASLIAIRYPDELAKGNSEAQQTLASLRALVTSKMVSEYASNLGYHDMLDVVDLDSNLVNKSIETLQFLLEQTRAHDAITKVTNKSDEVSAI